MGTRRWAIRTYLQSPGWRTGGWGRARGREGGLGIGESEGETTGGTDRMAGTGRGFRGSSSPRGGGHAVELSRGSV